MAEAVAGYRDAFGFTELARRYACNLANGRFLWRNRLGAEQVEVRIRLLREGEEEATWCFNALDIPLRHFDTPEDAASAIDSLAAAIEEGLGGERFTLVEVTSFARLGAGQEVFPSQELIMDRARGDKSKTLYEVDSVAAMHSQKIGNAIRSIDTWYPKEEADVGPIAVEPYGSVTTHGKAYRAPRKGDFYTLLDGWIVKGKVPAPDEQHFVIATLIRGGVFGESGSA